MDASMAGHERASDSAPINLLLPGDLLQAIFGWVPTAERARTLPLVCPLWNDLLKGPSSAWGHQAITVTDAYDSDADDVLRSLLDHLERRGAATTSVDLVYDSGASADSLGHDYGVNLDSDLLAAVGNMPHLRVCALGNFALHAHRARQLLCSHSLQDLEVNLPFCTTATDLLELRKRCVAPLKRLRLGLYIDEYVETSRAMLGAVSAFSSVPCLLLRCHDFLWTEGPEDDHDLNVSGLLLPRGLTDLPCLQALDVDHLVRLQGPLPENMTRLDLKCSQWGDVYPGLQGHTGLRVLRLEFSGGMCSLSEGLDGLALLQELAITMPSHYLRAKLKRTAMLHEVKLCSPQLKSLSLQGCGETGFLLSWEAEPHVEQITLRGVRTTSELPFHRLTRLTSLVLDCCEGPSGPPAWSHILPNLPVSLREVQLRTTFSDEASTTLPSEDLDEAIVALPFECLAASTCVHLTKLQKLRLVCGAVKRPEGSVDFGPKNAYISSADIGLVREFVHTSLPGCARVLFQLRVVRWHVLVGYLYRDVTFSKCAGAGARLFDTHNGDFHLQGPDFNEVWRAVESAALFDASSVT